MLCLEGLLVETIIKIEMVDFLLSRVEFGVKQILTIQEAFEITID